MADYISKELRISGNIDTFPLWGRIPIFIIFVIIRYFIFKCVKSRLTIVSREAKKSQRPLSELSTRNTAKKLANALAKTASAQLSQP